MTKADKKYPDVGALVPRFVAFIRSRERGMGTALFWALDKHPEAPGGMREYAVRDYGEDSEGLALYEIACELSETQRNKLRRLIEDAER